MLQDEWAEEALRLDSEEDDSDHGSRARALEEEEEEEEEVEVDAEEDEGWEDLGDLLGDEGLDVIEVRHTILSSPMLPPLRYVDALSII